MGIKLDVSIKQIMHKQSLNIDIVFLTIREMLDLNN